MKEYYWLLCEREEDDTFRALYVLELDEVATTNKEAADLVQGLFDEN